MKTSGCMGILLIFVSMWLVVGAVAGVQIGTPLAITVAVVLGLQAAIVAGVGVVFLVGRSQPALESATMRAARKVVEDG